MCGTSLSHGCGGAGRTLFQSIVPDGKDIISTFGWEEEEAPAPSSTTSKTKVGSRTERMGEWSNVVLWVGEGGLVGRQAAG